MVDLFKEIIPSLLQNNDHLLENESEEKDYSPYLVNKAMSQHIDCIFGASLMNLNPHLDPKLQYDFYFYNNKKYRRKFQKWFKSKETAEESLIMEFFNCSRVKSRYYLSVLSPEQIKIIKEKLDKGGKSSNNK